MRARLLVTVTLVLWASGSQPRAGLSDNADFDDLIMVEIGMRIREEG